MKYLKDYVYLDLAGNNIGFVTSSSDFSRYVGKIAGFSEYRVPF
jgi:hypothetical protein